jgi:hypothetical protein
MIVFHSPLCQAKGYSFLCSFTLRPIAVKCKIRGISRRNLAVLSIKNPPLLQHSIKYE